MGRPQGLGDAAEDVGDVDGIFEDLRKGNGGSERGWVSHVSGSVLFIGIWNVWRATMPSMLPAAAVLAGLDRAEYNHCDVVWVRPGRPHSLMRVFHARVCMCALVTRRWPEARTCLKT